MEILVLHQLKAQGEIVNNPIQIILIYKILSRGYFEAGRYVLRNNERTL